MSDKKQAREAVQLLFKDYAGDVYRFARVMLGSDSDAKDIVQEVFIRAFRSWDGFRRESNPKTWLITIARNCIYDLYGKRKREADFLTKYEPPYLPEDTIHPETVLVVEEALSNLKDTYRQVVFLRHIENLSVQETADILGWSESRVTTTTQRALGKLRKLLTKDGERGGQNEN